ncbi:MAG: aminoacetone oxidase family FAD-binding enzyme [Eubacteriales bacterium]|nr:aminoacetone oxidase family FAD-binding enzyme [Eubacteriales bacterium]
MAVATQKVKVLIIGAGPSGLAAAIAAGEAGLAPQDLVVLEAQNIPGRKILASGNGRCNLGNLSPLPENYHSSRPELAERLLEKLASAYSLDFWRRAGIAIKADEAGRLYPQSEEAAAVQRMLLRRVSHFGFTVEMAKALKAIARSGKGYLVTCKDDSKWEAEAVILALGGPGGADLGANAKAQALFDGLGLDTVDQRPALTQILLKENAFLKRAQGSRFKGSAQIASSRSKVRGEFLFSQRALSGIAALDLSNLLANTQGSFKDKAENSDFIFSKPLRLELDFLTEYTEADLRKFLEAKQDSFRQEITKNWIEEQSCLSYLLDSLINAKQVKAYLLAEGKGRLLDTKEVFSKAQLAKLAHALKHFPLTAIGLRSYKFAQTANGGLSLSELDENLQIKKYPGLFAVGECLDLTGNCGGYNLYFAFASGYLAGQTAKAYLS